MVEQPLGIPIPITANMLLPPPQQYMPIPLEEWDRLIGRIESCKMSTHPWSVAYSVAFGVGVTAGLSIAPIAFSRLPWWVLTVYIVLCAVGLVSGIIFVVGERTLARSQRGQIDNRISDMRSIRASFTTPPI